jgi:DNA-binding response OmpR family regulator
MKILIASSDIEETGYIQKMLNIHQPDWELSIAGSGKQCLESVKNGCCPDIVVLDINISDTPCFYLIDIIRDDSDVPIIVLSDDKEMDTLVRAFDAGASDYIVKPFNKAVFIARLNSLYRRRKWDMQAVEKRQKEIPVNNAPMIQ